jgi:O-antigen/teichoic acid export membrane protein
LTGILSILKLQKNLSRKGLTIAAYSVYRLSPPLFNLIISALVVRLFSPALWGEFVTYSLIVNVVLTITSFGQQEYLTRRFATTPSEIFEVWFTSLISRAPLVLVMMSSLLLFEFSAQVNTALMIWLVVSFVYRSFDVLNIYFKNFSAVAILETFSNAIIVATLLLLDNITGQVLIIMFSIATAAKVFGSVSLYWKELKNHFRLSISPRLLSDSFPFFLPTAIGLLQSRVDMYVIAVFLTKAELAKYFILISLLSLVHQFALLLITPYTKSIFRLPLNLINNLAKKFFRAGILISMVSIPATYIVLTFYYKISPPPAVYPISFLLMLPLFFYSIKTYQWLKLNKPYEVVKVNAVMAVLTFALSWVLVPYIGITGALAANCVSQWVAFVLFYTRKFTHA